MNQSARILRTLFPGDVSVAAGPIDTDPVPALFAEERRAIARAVPARQREFAAGRRFARLAMQQLGIGARAIPVGQTRAPIWPEGLAGSITHGAGVGASCVGWHRSYHGLGIDCEAAVDFRPELRELVMRDAEAELERSVTGIPARLWPVLLFSIKESAFKAYHALVPQLLGFDDLRVYATSISGRFVVEIGGRARLSLALPCHVAWDAERVYSGAWIARGSAAPRSAAPRRRTLPEQSLSGDPALGAKSLKNGAAGED